MSSDQPPTFAKKEDLPDGVAVYIEGDIEFTRAPFVRTELIALLNQKQPKRLIMELSGVPYMDSSGIATIVEALQHQRRKGNRLVLCCLQDKVFSMFQIANLDTLFDIADDMEQAKQA